MGDLLNGILENTSLPVVTAFVLGLLTAISPCPLATNITAIGFISKDIESRNRVFFNGLFYTLGRAVTYTILALIIMIGADQFKLSGWFQQNGEKIVGPLLLIIGLLMLDVLKIKFPGISQFTKRYEKNGVSGYWEVVVMGILFALAFCPYSGVLYFGMLIPMSITSPTGLYLPVVFALATGIPVIIFAWLLAYTVSGVGKLYHRLKMFEIWFRRIIAVLFIGVGLYYIIKMFI
ncbi:MAG: sulfite exporter TauE/SafE family protein [Bacteroidales bacterium]|nr:sulfite exporter TauE/SafE family protein [Bacteroidales bacterium]